MSTTASASMPPLTQEERRARKLARREKQREANMGRAAKMHEARIDHPLTATAVSQPARVNVGCSGWFYWHWRGLFYPEGMPTKDWFPTYRTRFPTVELNAPFYSWPTHNGVKAWLSQAGEDPFLYTVKVCELITHVKRFKGTKTLVRDFCYIADSLGPKMGCFLFQLPPSFNYTPARLKAVLGQLDPTRRNVVEFRHKSWWNEKVYDAFRKTGTIFCSCSAPRLPDVLIKTAGDVYLRFHGRAKWYRHDYTRPELDQWKERIVESGAERIWAYFNNDREGFALENAATFCGMLSGA